MAEFYRKKKKICQMCAGKDVDYKNVDVVKKYVSNDKTKTFEETKELLNLSDKYSKYINFKSKD